MITKGIITSIDLNGNTCEVRMPLFETAGNDQISGTAIISNTPGSYNGYKVGDVVTVGFEDGFMSKPVVLGKLYLGVAAEKADPRGVINVESLTSDKVAALPADTKLNATLDPNVPNTTVPYNSLASVANGLNTLNTNFGQMDRFINNQFKSIIEDWDGNTSIIEQLSDRIDNKVENKSTGDGFGWVLNANSWTLNTYVTPEGESSSTPIPIFKASKGGVEITNSLKIVGYPTENVTRYCKVHKNDQPIIIKRGGTGEIAVWQEVPPKYRVSKVDHVTEIWDYTSENLENYKNGDPKESTLKKYYTEVIMPGIEDNYWVWEIDYAKTWKYDADTDQVIEDIMNIDVYPLDYGNDPRLSDKPASGKRDPARVAEISRILNETKVLAQGKSTNYYSVAMPVKADYPNLRINDCWFDTSEHWVKADTIIDGANLDGSFDTREKYNNYYLKNGNNYTLITPATSGITVNSTIVYKKDKNVLRQLTDWETDPTKVDDDNNPLPIWTDISGELVANKLTANYINAMDITAKKITVLDKSDNNKKLFEADGINGDGSVSIANFTVKNDKLYSNSHSSIDSTSNGIYIGSDGISIGNGFKVSSGGAPTITGYLKTTHKKYCRIAEDKVAEAESNHSAWWNTWANPTTETGCIVWQDTVPDRVDNTFIWEWSKAEMGNSTGDINTWVDQGKICLTGAGGAKGDTGKSVKNIKTYYSLSNITSGTGPATGDSNIVTTPTVNKWSLSPQAFSSTYARYIYWKVERIEYKDPSEIIWETPVKASMLDVDFINALGITAKFIEVKDSASTPRTIFKADSNNKLVSVGGFTVDYNSIYNGDPEHWASGDVVVSRGTTAKLPITGAPANTNNWAFAAGKDFGVTNSGSLYAGNATISGAITATTLTATAGGSLGPFTISDNSLDFSSDWDTVKLNYLNKSEAQIVGDRTKNNIECGAGLFNRLRVANAHNQYVNTSMFLDNAFMAVGGRGDKDETQGYLILFNWVKSMFSVPYYYSYEGDMSSGATHYYKIVRENPNRNLFDCLIPMRGYTSNNNPTNQSTTTCKIFSSGYQYDSSTEKLTLETGQVLAVFAQPRANDRGAWSDNGTGSLAVRIDNTNHYVYIKNTSGKTIKGYYLMVIGNPPEETNYINN